MYHYKDKNQSVVFKNLLILSFGSFQKQVNFLQLKTLSYFQSLYAKVDPLFHPCFLVHDIGFIQHFAIGVPIKNSEQNDQLCKSWWDGS